MNNVVADALKAADEVKAVIAPKVGGLTSYRIRALLNLIASRVPEDEAYLEIGVHIGGTLIPALINNKKVTAYACDNWEFEQCIQGHPKEVFYKNLAQYQAYMPQVQVTDLDCWKYLEKPPFTKPIGAYFYDAGHSEADQYNALVKAYPYLAKSFMFVVDDFRWEDVQRGTWRAICDMKFKRVDFVSRIPPKDEDVNWHNGLGLFYLEK